MSWNVAKASQRVRILAGYNAPFALWTLAALTAPLWRGQYGASCMTSRLLGWCPGCGLTRGYSQLLYGGGLAHWWLGLILIGFVANGVASVIKAQRVTSVSDAV